MNRIPDGLKLTPTGFLHDNGAPIADIGKIQGGVLRPMYGSYGSLHAEFRIHEEYSDGDSVLAGKEVKRPVEICIIQSDKYSRVPKRMNELSRKEQVALAPLYERFKTQMTSGETNVLEWDAASDQEKAQLGMQGIWTVEQLHNMPEHDRFRLGPGYNDLWTRAERHMITKRERDPKTKQKELESVRDENRALAARLKRLEEEYFAKQSKIAATQSKPRGRPKKIKEETPVEAVAG